MDIGIWISVEHFAAAGPTSVIIGILIGIKQAIPVSNILINEPGFLNFQIYGRDRDIRMFPANTIFGPNSIGMPHIGFDDPNQDEIWKYARNLTFSSRWVIAWLEQKFPLLEYDRKKEKAVYIWEAGIDTEYFSPGNEPKTQDFFIYYKSQKMADIEGIWSFLFHNFYGIKGNLICYHFYKPEMLREAARKSRFCIMLDNEETQGLAALEIMACDCPIFCIDKTTYTRCNKLMDGGVTSITCWSPICGLKTTLEKWKEDFPIFLTNLLSYKPYDFTKAYSYRATAVKLLCIGRDTMNHVLRREQSSDQTLQ
jgi:hypothetical protein